MQPETDAQNLADSFKVAAWVHFLGGWVNRKKPLWIRIGNLETAMLSEIISDLEIRQPVYVTGLARSGSTLLLEILNRHHDTASHWYRDYPMLFIPFIWNRYLAHTPQKNNGPKERTHADGILITPQSPEAFEEILWMAFFPGRHDPGQSGVLDAGTENPRFEEFYRDHIRKLLAVRGGRRYLAKGNYNITRLAYLLKIFKDARFVIPVREPIWHIASLMNQHRRFCLGQQLVPRARAHLQRIGHFEFGLDRIPIHVGNRECAEQIIDLWQRGAELEGWATYWACLHNFIFDQLSEPKLNQAALILRYENLCRYPDYGVRALFNHCRLPADDMLLSDAAKLIKPPVRQRPAIFSNKDLALIERCTSDSAQRLGLGSFLSSRPVL